jgi:penicillin-insensitive murein endopeptidase
MKLLRALAIAVLLSAAPAALAQDKGTLVPASLTPLPKPDDPANPAKEVFGRLTKPVALAARSIGYYSKGCLAGAMALPINGTAWQVMRLSRNRNWGHPKLIAFLEKFAEKAKAVGWNGLLVGDMAQPRGGPMLTGHLSHQVGLDADIWLTPMPDHELTREERETMSAINMVRDDWKDIDPAHWTTQHFAFLKLMATQPEVDRMLVNAAIKKALCRTSGKDRSWLHKVRPFYGHNWHVHVRMACPGDSPDCQNQPALPAGDGCGKELDVWFTDKMLQPKKLAPKPPMKLADLPEACRKIAVAP